MLLSLRVCHEVVYNTTDRTIAILVFVFRSFCLIFFLFSVPSSNCRLKPNSHRRRDETVVIGRVGRCELLNRRQTVCSSLEQSELECGPMPIVMAALPNIGGALCESSVIPFLVAYHAAKFGWSAVQ